MSDAHITYHFSGVVLPERADVNFPLPVKVVSAGKGKLPAGWEVSVSVVRSQLFASVTADREVTDLREIQDLVEGISRFCVDAIGFLVACGYDVEITQVTGPDPRSHVVFGVNVPGVVPPERQSNEEVFARFKQILETPGDKQRSLRRALVDFREAIRSVEDTAFFCFRAIEDLRQYFVVVEDRDVKTSWNELAQKAKIPEETMAFVKDVLRPIAIPARHGNAKDIGQAERIEMLAHTWKVIDRFISENLEGPNHRVQPTPASGGG